LRFWNIGAIQINHDQTIKIGTNIGTIWHTGKSSKRSELFPNYFYQISWYNKNVNNKKLVFEMSFTIGFDVLKNKNITL